MHRPSAPPRRDASRGRRIRPVAIWRRRALSLVGALALSAACGEPPGPGNRPPAGADELLVPEREWGSADGDSGGIDFGSISSIAVSPSSDVYVADERAASIFVFDASGRYLRRIGRDGEGPGEFRWLRSLGFAGDTLRAFDVRLWRMTSLTADGRVARIDPVPPEEDFGQPADFAFARDGALHHLGFGRYQASLEAAMTGRRHGRVRGEVTVERWSPGDSAWTVTVEAPGLEVFVDMDEGSLSDPWFARRLLWASAPAGGAWTGDTETGTLVRWAANGTRLAEARVPLTPEPFSDADRAAFANAEDVADEARRTLVRNRRRAVELPPTKPVVRSMLPTAEGGILVAERLNGVDPPVRGGNAGQDAARRWFAYDAAGRLVATLALAARTEPFVVAGDAIWAVGRDSLDVQRIEKWTVRR